MLQERGHDIYTRATEIVMALVRILPCVPRYIFFMHFFGILLSSEDIFG